MNIFFVVFNIFINFARSFMTCLLTLKPVFLKTDYKGNNKVIENQTLFIK